VRRGSEEGAECRCGEKGTPVGSRQEGERVDVSPHRTAVGKTSGVATQVTADAAMMVLRAPIPASSSMAKLKPLVVGGSVVAVVVVW
jgi:hypothetical protein